MFDTFGEKSLDHLIDVCTRRFEEHEREAKQVVSLGYSS